MKALPTGHMLAVQLLPCMQRGAEHGAGSASAEASAGCIIQCPVPLPALLGEGTAATGTGHSPSHSGKAHPKSS